MNKYVMTKPVNVFFRDLNMGFENPFGINDR